MYMWHAPYYCGRVDATNDARSYRPSGECTHVKGEGIALLRNDDHRICLRVTAVPPNGQYTVRAHGNGAALLDLSRVESEKKKRLGVDRL